MLKATKFHLERKIAIEAVRKASKVCLQVFNSLAQGETVVKDDKSPVTVADYSAQAVINTILSEKFPNDPIVGEEDANFLRTPEGKSVSDRIADLVNTSFSIPKTNEQILDAIDKGNYQGGSKGRFWTLDPIDGTKGFLRGGQFAVCLALIVNGSVELGVLGCPNLLLKEADSKRGVIFVAERGNGAYQQLLSEESENWELIRMTKLADISKARFCESVESGHSSS
ncbi:3'(2'),5'-bisphosphate nucleotidase [Entomophthora muscae]|uniref:3'(2'),5'-bisphosphate nucleotidase n=1 Tax=Entomophthora muscae TaxID=34485 RepID=A0ACC2TJS0_9FUNG|nr:3'(2'),5'-bisphosphate nucleotidase [Entomophthora muscae]